MGENIRVLLVDDDEDEYILTKDLLADRSYHSGQVEQARFDLDWVDNFEAGLEALKQDAHDVYLVDYHLGERNGLELVQAGAEMGCNAPMILMTGQGSYAVDVKAMKAGATDYLVKGEVSPPLLERTIRYAIERKRAEDKIRRNAARSELLATLSQSFAEAGLYYPAVLSAIAHQIAESTRDACIIRLISDDGEWLDPVAFHHPDPDALNTIRTLLESQRLRADEGLEGQVLQKRKPLVISKGRSAPVKNGNRPEKLPFWEYGFHSALIVPLHAKGRLIGTLVVLRSRPNARYTDDDRLFFQDLADRAALSIENARLYLAEAQRVRELNALHSATSEILSTIDLETLLSRTLDIAQDAIPVADKSILHLSTENTEDLQILANSGEHDPRIIKVQLPPERVYPASVIEDRAPILYRDVQEEPSSAEILQLLMLSGVRSVILAPLILKDEILGVLSLGAVGPSAFTEADKRLLMSFANTTTAALQNAMLLAQVRRLALTDSLTDIYNRRGFFEFGRREIERAARFGRSLSGILVDVDYFKDINDTYGHAVGDQVLRIVAERIKASVREIDIIGRYGGDEFIVLLPETDKFTASIAAERIRLRLCEPLALNGPLPDSLSSQNCLNISASLGVASNSGSSEDLASLISRADAAAYLAKQSGRNRVEIG